MEDGGAMLDFFLILLLSHLLTDFVFQTDAMVACKYGTGNKARMALSLHAGIFFITSLSLSLIIQGVHWFTWFNLLIVLLLSLSHYVVDLLKGKIINSAYTFYTFDLNGTGSGIQVNFGYPNWLFWADQFAHLVFISVFTIAAFHTAITWELIPARELLNNLLPVVKPFSALQKTLIFSCILIFITSFANIIIKKSLKATKLQITSSGKELIAGRYIGAFERILTVIAIVAGAYEAIAILFASKTAIRFSQIQGSAEFRDYYILGTLISVFLGVLGGIFARLIFYQ